MGNGIGCAYKHSQQNNPYQYSNTKFSVPPCSALSSHWDITNDFSATLIAHNHPSSISHLTTTNQVDTDVKNDDITQYFTISRKNNHGNPGILETKTKTAPVRPNINSRQFQISSSTSITALKLTPSGKEYLCFKIDRRYSHEEQYDK